MSIACSPLYQTTGSYCNRTFLSTSPIDILLTVCPCSRHVSSTRSRIFRCLVFSFASQSNTPPFGNVLTFSFMGLCQRQPTRRHYGDIIKLGVQERLWRVCEAVSGLSC